MAVIAAVWAVTIISIVTIATAGPGNAALELADLRIEIVDFICRGIVASREPKSVIEPIGLCSKTVDAVGPNAAQ
jgi:hypothetical protein